MEYNMSHIALQFESLYMLICVTLRDDMPHIEKHFVNRCFSKCYRKRG